MPAGETKKRRPRVQSQYLPASKKKQQKGREDKTDKVNRCLGGEERQKCYAEQIRRDEWGGSANQGTSRRAAQEKKEESGYRESCKKGRGNVSKEVYERNTRGHIGRNKKKLMKRAQERAEYRN